MSDITLPFINRSFKPLPALLILAVVFGTLDMLEALLFWGFSMDVPPIQILQGIASSVLGSVAFHAGAATALLGALLQYGFFFCLLGVYRLATTKLTFLTRRPLVYGLLYGLLSYVVMRYGVLPLSAYHIVPGFYPAEFINTALSQTVFVGLATAFMVHELHSKEESDHRTLQEIGHASPGR